MQLWALIVDGFRESRDRKIFWVMLGITVLIAAVMACVGYDETGVTILFKWHLDDPTFVAGTDAQRAHVTGILIYWAADKYIGIVGIALALIATAGFFPSMMEQGAIDAILSKPISRLRLFFGKYLASMTFVFVQSAVFVVLTFLVVGIRWKQWLWPYFWCIPLSVILFSYIYAFYTFFAVRMRGSLAPLLLTFLCWFGIFLAQSLASAAYILPPELIREDSPLRKIVPKTRWIVPKTQDIPHIAARLIDPQIAEKILGQASFDDVPQEDREQMEAMIEGGKEVMSFNIAASLLSSLGIEAIVLLLAAWKFHRRDF
ncbi:MAG TPA: ABC transporter permease [Phycisphaerae bacterium]|nr:ABC transporter permease [Phycisphaerae bacterium]